MIGRIDIKAPTGQTILSPVLHDESLYSRTLMGEHSVRLRFDWNELVTLPIGTYIEYLGERYTLPSGYAPRQGAGLYEYSVSFLAREMMLRDRLFFYLSQGYSESRWSLTGTLEQFAKELRINIQACQDAELVIALEQENPTLHKTLDVDAMTLFDALGKVAELFEVEWWRSGNTYYIGHMPQGDVPLEVRLGHVADSFTPQGEPLPLIGRLYAFGGTKNLPPHYGEKSSLGTSLSRIGEQRLRLPEGTSYIAGAEGGRDHVERFEDIYPKYTGTITSVSHRMAGKTPIYKFADRNFRVEKQHILEGQTLAVVFETGPLAGMEFELALLSDGYEIKPNDKYGQTLPNEVIFPTVENKFSPFGIDLFQVRKDLVPKAEQMLLERATEWLTKNNRDERDVELRTNPVYCYEERIELSLGQSLRLIEATPTGDKVGRITALSYPLSNPHEMRCTVGNSRPVGFGERLAGEADKAKTEAKAYTDSAEARTLEVVRRQWGEVEALGKSLEQTFTSRFSGKIDPLLVRTMQLLAGDESLQFAFVERPNADAPKLSPNIRYDRASNTLRLEAGAIRHYTLGITELKPKEGRAYRHWAMPQYRSHRIEYTEREYFLYAIVPRAESELQGRYSLLDAPVDIDHTEGDYHLLVGVLGVEREGDRVFTPLYGFSEVLPGRITSGRITSADGRTYFDLDHGIIGGNIQFRGPAPDDQEVDAKGYIDNLIKATNERIRDTELSVEYSADGRTNWHQGGRSTDRYLRQRVGQDGLWSDPIRIAAEDTILVQVWSQSGNSFVGGQVDTELVAFVYRGAQEIGQQIPPGAYSWERISGNPDTDRVWNSLHSGIGRKLKITNEDVTRRANFNVIVNID